MSHGPSYYDSKGYCIYCGATGVRLTDEHIIPFSLGGSHVLRKASCNSCSKITSKFEMKIARGLWGEARNSYDAPSRRKKNRIKTLLVTDYANPHVKRRVLRADLPAAMIFYKMPNAGVLSKIDENFDGSIFWKLYGVSDDCKQLSFKEKYDFEPVLSFSHHPQEFGQLLLKIGYGQILTNQNCEDFDPLCLPYILGQKTNVSWLVGCEDKESIPIPNIGYSMRTSVIGYSDSLLLIAHIKLWAHMDMPWYHAVIGRVTGASNMARVVEKLGKLERIDIPLKN